MSGRTYLSIGDVLTLLRREFPDVTISKIRFLESQGLVDPERTPSGYRKFYDHDVERLRWVLRQQREHFLPLKVIKGRLEKETASERQPNGHGHGGAETRGAEPASVLVGSSRPSGPGPSRSGLENAAGSFLSGSKGHAFADSLAPEESSRSGGADERSRATRVGHRGEAQAAAEGRATGRGPRVAGTSGAAAPGPARRAQPTQQRGRDREVSELGSLTALTGTSMTSQELSAATGLSPSVVRELESFGLLSGRSVGGDVYYDESALVVANLAASFARYGVEPRHLRLHLLAAQREAGFVEQIVVPLLKQRNPASRQKALETVAELTRLGQELRAELLQRSLSELLGG